MSVSAGYKVNTVAELKALTTNDKITGYARLVVSFPAWFMYSGTATDSGDDINVITPNSNSGRWLRLRAIPAATDIQNLTEFIDDRVANLLQQGTNITLVYNDSLGTLTINSTGSGGSGGLAEEEVQDVVGAMFIDSSTIDFTYNDTTNTITASLLTGGLSTNQIGNFNESVDDRVSALLQEGSNISLTYNDVSNTLTISANQTAYTDEMAQDAIGNILIDSSTIDFTYNDTSNSITAIVIAGSIGNTQIATNAEIAQSKIANLVTDLSNKSDINHTHTTSNITNFTEDVQDVVGSFIVQGSNINLVYDDNANSLTINSTTSVTGLGSWDDLYGNVESSWDSNYA